MPFFEKLFPPNIDAMKAKHDVPGLIKALDYEKEVNGVKDLSVAWRAAMALVELGPATIEPLRATNYTKFATIALGMLRDTNYNTLESLRSLVSSYDFMYQPIPDFGSLGRMAAIILCNLGVYSAANSIIEGIDNEVLIDDGIWKAINENIQHLTMSDLSSLESLLKSKIYGPYGLKVYSYYKDGAINRILDTIKSTRVNFILKQIAGAGKVSARIITETGHYGENALYCDDKQVAVVYGNQLFVMQTAGGGVYIGNEMAEASPDRAYFLIPDKKWSDSEWMIKLIQITAQESPGGE